jgi:hypothetical protein
MLMTLVKKKQEFQRRLPLMVEKKLPTQPITDDEAKRLLLPHEDIRDPVHRDIKITALERKIIDTGAFQRLRSLKQLGPVHLVFPGAVHTRFLHSLGSLHCAQQLVDTVNYNYSVYERQSLMRIDPYPHLLVRLCALLHDVAHLPFGHIFEDEGNIAPSQWEDDERVKFWIGPDKEIPCEIRKFLKESGISATAAEQVVEDVRKYTTFKGNLMELEYPFVVDLIGNTICADLIDYVERDMFFCGLREKSGDRVVKYMAIVRVNKESWSDSKIKDNSEATWFLPSNDPKVGKGRLVLLTYRFEREHLAGGNLKLVPQPKILSEAIDLLRRRYALAEKVYFHRTKLAASAMLISAVESASLKLEAIYNLSEDKFLSLLESDSNPRTQHLVNAYKARRLYYPIYRLNYREKREADPQSIDLWENKYPNFRTPGWRKKKEEEIETYANLPLGSIAIYCPHRKMNLKEFKTLVQNRPDGEVKPLEEILDRNRKLEMDSINQPFAYLWNLQIFVDPEVMDVSLYANEAVQNLNAICETIIEFPNDIMELQGKGCPLREQLAERVIQEWEEVGNGDVPHRVFLELVQAPHRQEGSELIEAFRKQLKATMKLG